MLFPRLDFRTILLSIPAFALAISAHEYAHALAANKMGDPTARLSGRLTLEPWAHLDLFGTLALIFFGFGWAKPVPVNPRNFRNMRRGMLLTALAGPAANLVVAFFSALLLVFRIDGVAFLGGRYLGLIFEQMFYLNVAFAVFNLLPIPPLDGSQVLMALLPGRAAYAYSRIAPYGVYILLVLVFTGAVGAVLGTLVYGLGSFIVAVAKLLAILFGL